MHNNNYVNDFRKKLQNSMPYLFAEKGYWIDGNYKRIAIENMDEQYLRNAIKMIRRQYEREFILCNDEIKEEFLPLVRIKQKELFDELTSKCRSMVSSADNYKV